MVRWFFQFLYGSISVRFASPYSVHESISRLSAIIEPSVFSSFTRQCAVGIVTEKKVCIQRVIPFVGNAWKPFFYGTFSSTGAGSVLEGTFKLSLFMRIFMSVWFGFIAFWTLLSTFVVLTKSPTELWFPLFGVCMFAAGIGMVHFGKWFANNDIAWLTQVVVQALGINGVQLIIPPDSR